MLPQKPKKDKSQAFEGPNAQAYGKFHLMQRASNNFGYRLDSQLRGWGSVSRLKSRIWRQYNLKLNLDRWGEFAKFSHPIPQDWPVECKRLFNYVVLSFEIKIITLFI
ncbi:hypothetical protein FGO68_gene8736 [Halteria grandinella]|uniref:Uncharacterized protein n=1 Tax=Halteria grandinella TaxID=5974 RepID=A0A8J8NP64_HALGN|nr:hypothetical protein FGO68_gene8736 [Halteria grandinella]